MAESQCRCPVPPWGCHPPQVFSHLDTHSHLLSSQPPSVSRGNELADAYAQRGAEEASAAIRGEIKALGVADACATLAQQRLAAVTRELASQDREQCARTPEGGGGAASRRVVELERVSGHHLGRLPNGAWLCRRCRQGPPPGSSLVDWLGLEDNRCKGDPTQRHLSDNDNVVLVPRPVTEELRTANRQVHPSHCVAMRNGQVWCWKCASLGTVVKGGVAFCSWRSRAVNGPPPREIII